MRHFTWTSRGLLAAAVILYLLQLLPFPGIFIMFLGGPFITGLLLDAAIIALFVEAMTGRVAFAWALVPVMAVGAYYGTYISQTIDLYHQNAALKASNPGQVIGFDQARYSLVSDDLSVSRYAVPVIYTHREDVPEGYLADVLLLRDQCNVDRDPGNHMFITGVMFDRRFKRNLCELHIPESPPHPIIETIKSGDAYIRYEASSGQQVAQLVMNGKVLGSSVVLMSQRLTLFPLFIAGCGLVDSTSSWQCTTKFMTRPVFLDGQDFSDENTIGQSEARMLGLRAYSEADLDSFRPYAATAPEAAHAARRAAKTMDDMMAQLRALASGDDIAPIGSMAYAVTTEPNRLVPLTASIANRFNELTAQIVAERAACPFEFHEPPPMPKQRVMVLHVGSSSDYSEAERRWRDCRNALPIHRNRPGQMRVLAYALSALPDSAFETIRQSVSDSAMAVAYNDSLHKLYDRLGVQPERCAYGSKSPLCDHR